MGDLVRTSGSDLGFVFDAEGECATIVDDQGTTLTNEQALLALVRLVSEVVPGARDRAPGVGEPRGGADRQRGGRARSRGRSCRPRTSWRSRGPATSTSPPREEGGFIWPTFLPAYDAAATLVHLLDLLAATDRPLSTVVENLPEPHVAHEAVPTPWEKKGTVMRGAIERAKDHEVVLVDGMKIMYPDGWALVLPDPELAGDARVGGRRERERRPPARRDPRRSSRRTHCG